MWLHFNCSTAESKQCVPLEFRVQKFYVAANAVMGKLGLVCRNVEVWKTILERQLLPVLSYAWRLNNKSVRDAVNTAWRRVIRTVLGMKRSDSVKEKLGSWFNEASVLMKRNQNSFCS